MEIEKAAPTDIASAVRTAREELAGVVRALTQVLTAVAETDANPETGLPTTTEDEAARKEREKRRSLEPVLARFDALRAAVNTAVGLNKARCDAAVRAEADVSPEEKTMLMERRAALVDEVRVKNERVKILIEHLRELHRDIVVLVGAYYVKRGPPPPPQGRKS